MGDRQRSGPDPVHVWVARVDREHRSAAHELLLALATELVGAGAVLRHDPGGRPWVELAQQARLWVSVSHGREQVAVAAGAGGPVGVDVESRRPFETADLARRWFDPAELTWLADQPDPLEGFLQLWTAKEAVGKALGTGLRGSGSRGSGLRRRMPLGDGLVPGLWPALAVLHLPVADAVLAVAVPAAAPEVLLSYQDGTHGATRRRAAASRTSFPVVVRGN